MEINAVRLANLLKLATKHDYAKDFCAAAGIEPSYLSQLKSGVKTLGSELSRKIEARLSIERGWLDDPRNAESMPEDHSVAAVAHAIEAMPRQVRNALVNLVFAMAASDSDQQRVPAFEMTVPDDGQDSKVRATVRR